VSDSNGSLPNSLTPEDKKITKRQINKHWKDVIVPALEHLKPLGVKIAPLKKKKDKSYHKMPLVLVFLSMHIGEPIHVQRLDSFVRKHLGKEIDVQARHIYGNRYGFHVLSSKKKDIGMEHIKAGRSGALKLVDLQTAHPNFRPRARNSGELDDEAWELLKKRFGNRCATCGSLEGQPHLHEPSKRTVLTKGHMDSDEPLSPNNTIPQCQYFCNAHYRDKFTFDDKGRVRHLYDGKFILRSKEQTKIDALSTIISDDPSIVLKIPDSIKKILSQKLLEEE